MKRRTIFAAALIGLILLGTTHIRAQENGDYADVILSKSGNLVTLSPKIIHDRIEMYILENYKENHDDIVIECQNFPTDIMVRSNDWDVKIDPKYGAIKNGSNLLDVTVYSLGGVYKEFSTIARVKTFDQVVVAKRMLDRHQKITEDDIQIQRVETTQFRRHFFRRDEAIVGHRTRQIIQKGKVIFANMVELPPVVKRGDVVKIKIILKNVEVTALGQALEDGRLGQTIHVKNISSGKRLQAKVINEKTVKVLL
ncbi:MAG: flagellar basal body P-ring formation protein FlgA [Calditrichaeota bacterium]|nr:flagellar basal body P-ring formation protein FlgA [Calditrichota bacterium]